MSEIICVVIGATKVKSSAMINEYSLSHADISRMTFIMIS
jgi:hypothetical protein